MSSLSTVAGANVPKIETEHVSDAEFAALSAAVCAAEAARDKRRQTMFRCSLHLWKQPGTFVIRTRPYLPCHVQRALQPLSMQLAKPPYDGATKLLCFPLAAHDVVCDIIAQFAPKGSTVEVPRAIRSLSQRLAERLAIEQLGISETYVRIKVGETLWDQLLNFQRDGVLHAVRKGGRILLADEMGMGKTLSALAIAEFYRDASRHASADAMDAAKVQISKSMHFNSSVLILCPSTLRDAWLRAVAKWLPHVPSTSIHCVYSAKDARRLVRKRKNGKRDVWDINSDVRFVVCSYDIIPRVLAELCKEHEISSACSKSHSSLSDQTEPPAKVDDDSSVAYRPLAVPPEMTFDIVIADECHSLKNSSSARAIACLPVILSAEYRILISGTPVTSRPLELFTQLQALLGDGPLETPFVAPSVFLERYCGGLLGAERGASHLQELNALLSMVMVRRTKSDVLYDLPPKIRSLCLLELTCERLRTFQGMYKELDELHARISTPSVSPSETRELKGRVHGLYTFLFSATASAKVPGVITRLRQLLEGEESASRKLLVFGYHRDMLHAIQAYLYRSRVQHIRVDGTTPQESRPSLIEGFQTNSRIRVAVLSIKVAGVGLTLTAANCILFAELDWVPGNLIQAEDRAHRIGRKDTLHIEYAVARGTLDDRLWPVLQRKLGLVGTMVDGVPKKEPTLNANAISAELPTSGVAVQATILAAQSSCCIDDEEHPELPVPET